MSFLETLISNPRPHFEERQALCKRLEVLEKNFLVQIGNVLKDRREGVNISIYDVPDEIQLVNRFTAFLSEARVDFDLSGKERRHAPKYIKDLMFELGAEPEDRVSCALIFAVGKDVPEDYQHFGLVFSPDPQLENRVGIALTSDANLQLFALGNFKSNGRYETVCDEFAVGMSGLHDTRVLEILCEAGEWLPKVIEARKVVGF